MPRELASRAERLAAGVPGRAQRLRSSAANRPSAAAPFRGGNPDNARGLDPGPLGADGLALRLRARRPPVVARVAAGRVLLDPRTLPEEPGRDRRALSQALAA